MKIAGSMHFSAASSLSPDPPMVPGRTFFFKQVELHRWVIVSNPRIYKDQLVVIVNFTTFTQGKDSTCVISTKDFNSLGNDSCIHYAGARGVPLDNLQRLISLSTCVSEPVLKKIREGFGKSKEPASKLKDILKQQGLIS